MSVRQYFGFIPHFDLAADATTEFLTRNGETYTQARWDSLYAAFQEIEKHGYRRGVKDCSAPRIEFHGDQNLSKEG